MRILWTVFNVTRMVRVSNKLVYKEYVISNNVVKRVEERNITAKNTEE